MTGEGRLLTAGAVGRTHGLDGSFHVERPRHPLSRGAVITLGGSERRVTRRGGTDERPLVRLEGISTREQAAALRGELLLVAESLDPLGEGEWLAQDLIGCRIEGLGAVQRVIDGPSCDVLELEDGRLIPLVADAVSEVDVGARRIEVRRAFLGLEDPAP